MADCRSRPPELLIKGVEQFNASEYYECHETLEALWLAEAAPVRELYQGLLQVGVGLYKQQRGEYLGAVGLLQRAMSHLVPCAPVCQGVDVASLISEAEQVRAAIETLGPERILELDQGILPRVRWSPRRGAGRVFGGLCWSIRR